MSLRELVREANGVCIITELCVKGLKLRQYPAVYTNYSLSNSTVSIN